MELEEGMYVRLDRNQGIARIDEYDEEYNTYYLDKEICDEWAEETFKLNEEDILKASHNIIDLIQVGDYVIAEDKEYAYPVVEIDVDNDEIAIHLLDDDISSVTYIESDFIKSIVTKEQFNSIKYVVNEVKEDE